MIKNNITRNKTSMAVAIIAGIFLLIDGVSGFAIWDAIKRFVINQLNLADNEIVQIVFAVLIFIAALGGIAVIAGGLLIGKDKVRSGKFIILLGTGLGIIGFIFSIILGIYEGNFTYNSLLTFGAIGIILSIVARMIAEKRTKKQAEPIERPTE
jgi:hypothetical protein